MDLNYERDLFIDKSALDEEWLDNSRRFTKWAKLHVEAITERDKVERNLDVVRATVEKEIRSNVAKGIKLEGIIKGTEAEFKIAVELDFRVEKAEQQLIEANKVMKMLAVAREAFSDRKTELENLVQLWRSCYWSDPRLPQGRPERSFEDMEEERQRRVLGQNPRLAGRE